MRRITHASFWIVLLFTFDGCGGERPAGQASDLAQAGQMKMAAGFYVLRIANTMPNDMLVYVSDGDEEMELGPVPANSSAEFTLTAPHALEVTLKATEMDGTHVVTGTVTLSTAEPQSWTIESN